MKVSAAYADYDATLATLGVPKAESRIPRRLEGLLERMARRVPIAIVTAKDFDFVAPRTSFAAAADASLP